MEGTVQGAASQTTLRERFSYGSYFFGQGLIYTVVSQYLMYFYTDYALLPPLVVSVLLFGGKVWDAVNDTLFGLVVDKVRFKNGERCHAQASAQSGASLRDTWEYLKGNRYLKLFYGYRVASGILSVSMLTFMCKYCLGDVKAVALVAVYSLPMIFLVYAASPALMRRFDKIVLYRTCICLTIVMYLVTFAVGYGNKTLVIFCMAVIAALAILPGILLGALPQDCVEYGTFKTSVRKEGITFALQSFVSKLNAAFASAFTGIALELIGYQGELAVPLAESWAEDFCIGGGDVRFSEDKALPAEGYCLRVNVDGAAVGYSAPAGAFCALMTLRQLALGGGTPCCREEDAPSLGLRGYLLDVGRGKIPTLDTLKQVVDLLAGLKYDHLQLYMEGMCFAYPSFPEYWRDGTPLTPREMRELSSYCRDRFITLTPCQNSLGHMGPWLARPEWKHLAEKEEGMVVHGIPVPPTTLDCRDPAALDFVRRLTDDLMDCVDAPYYNACLDEPFELGKGKNAALAAQKGEGALYLDYVAKLHGHIVSRGRTMMMWGDVIARDPRSAASLPEDIVLLEWGYEAGHPFERRAALLEELGRPFCLCPGTSTWHSVTGITDNMLSNVRQAAAAHAHGAMGLLLTDWGDDGHLQYWPFNWGAIVLAGALAWNGANLTEGELAAALVKEELDNALALVSALTYGRAVLLAGGTDAALAEVVEQAIARHRRLWLARNERGGLELASGRLEAFARALRGEAV